MKIARKNSPLYYVEIVEQYLCETKLKMEVKYF